MSLRHVKSATALFLVSLALAGCGGTPQQKEARYLKRGDELYAEGKFDKARVEYMNAVRLVPDDSDAAYKLGMTHDVEGDFQDAYLAFTGIEQRDPHFHPALLKLAQYYLAGGEYDSASQRIDSVLGDTPNDPQAHALQAAKLLHQNMYDQSIAEAQKALSADDGNTLAYEILAGNYKAQNDPQKALETVQTGLNHNPKSQTLLLSQAQLMAQSGDLAGTTAAYQALFALAPTDRSYRLQLAETYLKADRTDDAEKTLRDAVAAFPDDWDMKQRLVLFLDDKRGDDVAEKEIRGYMAAYPKQPEPVDWLVQLYAAHGKSEQANALLDGIVAQNKYDALWINAMAAKARIDYVRGDRDAAAQRVADILARDPNNLNAQFLKAHIEADQGLYPQAIVDLRGIIRDRPGARETYRFLADVLLHQGHTDLAIETYNQLADVAPLDAPDRVRQAQLYALNNDTHHAMELLFIATQSDPAYPGGWETTARLALDLKDWSTADAAIDRLDKLPDGKMAAALLRADKLGLTGKEPAAIDAYKAVIGTDASTPQANEALSALFHIYQLHKQWAEAAAYLETLKPPTPMVDTMLGRSYEEQGSDDKAGASFARAIAAHPLHQEAYLEDALFLIHQHDNDAALAVLDQAIQVDPGDLRAPSAKLDIYDHTGRYRDEIALYDKLLAAHNDNDAIANNLAETIADHAAGDAALLDHARQVAERFAASYDPLRLDTLAWVYYRLNRIDDARAIYARAVPLGGERPPQYHYHYGAVLMAAGDREQALAELRLATASAEPFAGRDDAEKLLTSKP